MASSCHIWCWRISDTIPAKVGHPSDSEMVAIDLGSVPSDRSLQTPLSAALRAALSNRSHRALHRAHPACSLIVGARASAEAVMRGYGVVSVGCSVGTGERSWPTRSAAPRWSVRTAWEYVLSVVWMSAWPRRSDTIFGCTPARSPVRRDGHEVAPRRS